MGGGGGLAVVVVYDGGDFFSGNMDFNLTFQLWNEGGFIVDGDIVDHLDKHAVFFLE